MFKEKYSSIFFKSNGAYCVYYPLKIFANTQDLKFGEYPFWYFPVFRLIACKKKIFDGL